MSRSASIEKFLCVPSAMVFDPDLPATVCLTYIRLYTLTRNPRRNSDVDLVDLAAAAGKSWKTLIRHLNLLQNRCYLQYHYKSAGRIILQFLVGEDERCVSDPGYEEVSRTGNNRSKFPEHRPYFPSRIMGYISYQDEQRE